MAHGIPIARDVNAAEDPAVVVKEGAPAVIKADSDTSNQLLEQNMKSIYAGLILGGRWVEYTALV